MFERILNRMRPPRRAPRHRPILLRPTGRHEPYGEITIDRIKQTLEEEDFAGLQGLYHYMRRDLKIASTVAARRQPLTALPYTVSSQNTALLDWLAQAAPLERLIQALSFAVYYGVSLVEVDYDIVAGKMQPDFRLISPRYLHAERPQALKTTLDHLYIKQDEKKRFLHQLDPNRIVFHKHAIDIGELTDFSLAAHLVWYFALKHLTLAHNMHFFDHVATPPLIAKTDQQEDDLIDTLYDLKSSAVGVVGREDVIECLNISSQADFLSFIEYLDRQITTLVLGATLATGEGQRGSYSQSKVHEHRQQETLSFDATLIAATLTRYLNRLERLNFARPQGVTFAFDLKAKRDLKALSEVVKNLTDSGFELDIEDIEAQFGFKVGRQKPQAPPRKDENSASVQRHHPALARMDAGGRLQDVGGRLQDVGGRAASGTSGRRAARLSSPNAKAVGRTAPATRRPFDTLDARDPLAGPAGRAQEAALLAEIERVLAEADSYEAARLALLAAYPDFAIDTLEAALFQAIGNSLLLAEAEPA